jgi:hypothetical protein
MITFSDIYICYHILNGLVCPPPGGSPVLLEGHFGHLTYRFLEQFRHMVGLLGRVISPSQGFYLHRTTQHRKMQTNIYALSEIRTHDPSNQPAKTHASDRMATVTGRPCLLPFGNANDYFECLLKVEYTVF